MPASLAASPSKATPRPGQGMRRARRLRSLPKRLTSRSLLPFLAVFPALAFLSACGTRVEEEVDLGYRGQARVDPYLALRQMLGRMGLETVSVAGPAQLSEDWMGDCLIMPATSSAPVARQVLRWVEGGGHLIYLVEGGERHRNEWFDDDRRAQMEERSRQLRASQGDDGTGGDGATADEAPDGPSLPPADTPDNATDSSPDPTDEEDAPTSTKGKYRLADPNGPEESDPVLAALGVQLGPQRAGRIPVTTPDGTAYQIAMPESSALLPPSPPAELYLHARSGEGYAIFSLPHGSGQITLFSHAQPLRNRDVDRLDHARLLWWLVSEDFPSETVYFMLDAGPSLMALLWLHGKFPLVALALTVALALWAAAPSSGPKRPLAPRQELDFASHVTASGQFLWRQGAHAGLLAPLRRSLRARIARRLGFHHQHQPSELAAAIAPGGSADELARLAALLGDEAPRDAQAFVQTVAQLQQLELSLSAPHSRHLSSPDT